MIRPHRIAALVTTSLVGLLTITSCSRSLMTAPEPEPEPAAASRSTDTVPPPVPATRLTASSNLSIQLPPIPPVLSATWQIVTSQVVRAGVEATVTGARYELEFSKGSLEQDETITIKDYDPDVLDVELGPHGTKFGEPVVLSFDFTGTSADPGSARYNDANPVEPVVFWLNEEMKRWEEVPSTTDWKNLRVKVRLEHFSRYVVGGKAGWKGQPKREQE